MSAGFRKSFLGFNCDDVINYIEASQAKFTRREAELNSKISELEAQHLETLSQIEAINAQKALVESELATYKAKCDEIEHLSESIGKLYLVSQTSAKNIINNSVESSKLANEEIFKNIDSIDTAHGALLEIRAQIEETTRNFINKVDYLSSSLEATKGALVERGIDSDKQLEEFNAVFNKINNTI